MTIASPQRLRWAIALLIFGCFFLAVQDVTSPLLWRDDGDADIGSRVSTVAEGKATRQIGFLALAGLGALGLVLPSRRGPAESRPNWVVFYPLLAIVGWSYLSLLWSADPALTLKRLVVFTALWTAVAAAVRQLSVRELVFVVAVYGVLSLSIGVYAELRYAAQQAGSESWRFSGTMSPNHSGLVATLLAMAMVHGLSSPDATMRGRFFRILVLFAALAILWMTRSRTSLAICVGAISVQCAMTLPPRRTAALAAIGAMAAAAGAFLYHGGLLGPVWEAALMGRENSDVRTLTGRTDIWRRSIEIATADPARAVVGYGWNTFWNAANTQDVSRTVGFPISEGHNAVLDAWLDLGVVGALAWPLAIVATAGAWLSRGGSERGMWTRDAAFAVGLCAAALVHGVAEASFTHAQFGTFVLFALCGHAAVRLPPEGIREGA